MSAHWVRFLAQYRQQAPPPPPELQSAPGRTDAAGAGTATRPWRAMPGVRARAAAAVDFPVPVVGALLRATPTAYARAPCHV
eukprot:5998944-Heterocapsa_arctica.AAC.1